MEFFEMKDESDFLTIIVAICVAGYAAIMLEYVACSELGWSLAQVRDWAILGVLLMSAMTLARVHGDKRSKVRGPR